MSPDPSHIPALSGEDVAVVVLGSTDVTLTRLAAIPIFGQAPVLWKALIAISPGHISLTRALSTKHVASLVAHGSQKVTRAG